MEQGDTGQRMHIEKNTVQETLVVPLYGRKVCSERFPQFFHDEEAARLVESLDYDFSEYGKSLASSAGLLGALEVAQRQNDVAFEIRDYLAGHEHAAVVNMGCGLDGSFRRCDNGTAHGYQDICPQLGLVLRVMVKACDRGMGMRIVKVQF